jgi:hypothetical protein
VSCLRCQRSWPLPAQLRGLPIWLTVHQADLVKLTKLNQEELLSLAGTMSLVTKNTNALQEARKTGADMHGWADSTCATLR